MTGGCCQLSGDSVISHTCQYTASPRDWLWATVNDLTGLRQGLGPETLNSPPGSCPMNYKSPISCLLDSQVVRKDIFPRFWHFCDLGSLVSQTMIQQRLRLVPTWFDFLFGVLDFRLVLFGRLCSSVVIMSHHQMYMYTFSSQTFEYHSHHSCQVDYVYR